MKRTVCLDWGSTSLRAIRFEDATPAERRHQARSGVKYVEAGRFEEAMFAFVGDWLREGDDVILSGMITSRNGWVESPYLPCPARLNDLRAHAVIRRVRGVTLHFLPGLCQGGAAADVMRGEEIQIFGLLQPGAEQRIVLPGTHSKWVTVEDGAVTGFRTFMTGEIFDLVLNHSLAGSLKEDAPFDKPAFRRGLAHAEKGALLREMFHARPAVLLGEIAPTAVRDYLSGLLIGTELNEAMPPGSVTQLPIQLLGEPALVAHYKLALDDRGYTVLAGSSNAAEAGFILLTSEPVLVA